MLDKVTEMLFDNLFVVIINTFPTCKCSGRAKLYNAADYQKKGKKSEQTDTFEMIIPMNQVYEGPSLKGH